MSKNASDGVAADTAGKPEVVLVMRIPSSIVLGDADAISAEVFRQAGVLVEAFRSLPGPTRAASDALWGKDAYHIDDLECPADEFRLAVAQLLPREILAATNPDAVEVVRLGGLEPVLREREKIIASIENPAPEGP